MNIKLLIVGLLGIVIGAVISGTIVSSQVKTAAVRDTDKENHMMMRSEDSPMTMNSMVSSLTNKSGDEFDTVFLSEMIEHHEGAVEMAKLAQKNAKHDELKQMADSIISAQTTEIDQMKAWQKDWNY